MQCYNIIDCWLQIEINRTWAMSIPGKCEHDVLESERNKKIGRGLR